MASASIAMTLTSAGHKGLLLLQRPCPSAFFNPLPLRPSKPAAAKPNRQPKLRVEVSLKEKAATGLTAAALAASMMIPEVAEAAGNDFSPSLKNFLLSIAAGGVVLVALFGAVVGVANFDPVKRS